MLLKLCNSHVLYASLVVNFVYVYVCFSNKETFNTVNRSDQRAVQLLMCRKAAYIYGCFDVIVVLYEICDVYVCRFVCVDCRGDGVDNWLAGSHCWPRRSYEVTSLPTTFVFQVEQSARVCVCVWSITSEWNDLTFDLDIWHGDSPWPYIYKFKFESQSHTRRKVTGWKRSFFGCGCSRLIEKWKWSWEKPLTAHCGKVQAVKTLWRGEACPQPQSGWITRPWSSRDAATSSLDSLIPKTYPRIN